MLKKRMFQLPVFSFLIGNVVTKIDISVQKKSVARTKREWIVLLPEAGEALNQKIRKRPLSNLAREAKEEKL